MDTMEESPEMVDTGGTDVQHEVGTKFKDFVVAYVAEFESKLDECATEAGVGGKGKAGKVHDTVIGPVKSAASAVGMSGAVVAIDSGWQYISGKKHREKAKRIARIFQNLERHELRRILVEAAGLIFYAFQSQFMLVTDAEGDWKRGLLKLATDARDRSISYIAKEENILLDDAVSKDLLTKALIHGKSKDSLTSYTTLTKPGRTLKHANNLTNWKSSELFEKVGVKFTRNDGQMKFYKRSLCDHDFGYRWSFNWEDENSLLNAKYEDDCQGNLQDSSRYLSFDELETKSELVLEDINKNDPQLKLNRIEDNTDEIKETLESVKLSQSEVIDVVAKHGDIAYIIQEINDIKVAISSEVPEEDEPIFNVVAPVKTFTGRTGELRKLNEKLQTKQKHVVVSQCASISGLGGMGKSELARKYAWEYHKLYKHIIWINCGKMLDTLKSFKKLAEDLKILKPTPDDDENKSDPKGLEKNLQSILAKIYKRLAKVKTLLIFDNVDHFEDIEKFIPLNLTPADEKPEIIITSRNSNWDIGEEGDVEVILLKEFTRDEATSYVKKSLEINDEDKSCDLLISELIETLCSFPLALHQAASCIKTKSSLSEGIQEYLNEFRDEGKKGNLLKWRPKRDRYTETTYTTWLVTFENIRKERNGDLAILLVEIMSYLAPDDISFEKIFIRVVKDKTNLKEAIDILVKYSIITVEANVANIHRLVQLVVRLWLKDNQREEEVLRIALAQVYPYLHESHLVAIWSYICNYTALIDDHFCILCEVIQSYAGFVSLLYYLVQQGNVISIRKIIDYLEIKDNLWDELCWEIGFENYVDGYRVNCNHNDPSLKMAGHETHIKYIYLFHAEVHKALKYSKTEELELFLQSFDKSLINSWFYGYTALHKSVESGNLNVVKLLIENGAGVNFYCFNEGAPFYKKVTRNLKMAQCLVDQGLQSKIADQINFKPICSTSLYRYPNNIPRLINTKLEYESKSKDDLTFLFVAAEYDHVDIVEFLINYGFDVNSLTTKGQTVCHVAVEKGSFQVVKYLLDNKLVDVNLRNERNETLLHVTAKHDQFGIAEYLVDDETHDKVDINAFDACGATSLFLAVVNGHLEIINFLIQHGANVDNLQNETTLLGQLKFSALHLAVALDCFEVVKILIEESNADVNMGLGTSVSPFQVAKFFSSTQVSDYLIKKGADISEEANSENVRRICSSFSEIIRGRPMILIRAVCYSVADQLELNNRMHFDEPLCSTFLDRHFKLFYSALNPYHMFTHITTDDNLSALRDSE